MIEGLVALAVVAGAAGVFYRGLEVGIRGARVAERDSVALALAQSKLAEAVSAGARSDTAGSGVSTDGLAWDITVADYAVRPPGLAAEPVQLKRIDVRVVWRDVPGRPVRDLTLTTFLDARPP